MLQIQSKITIVVIFFEFYSKKSLIFITNFFKYFVKAIDRYLKVK